ncbi:MAG: M6 family metalloprotease domain-containing protein [Rikenellaceae bacterium]
MTFKRKFNIFLSLLFTVLLFNTQSSLAVPAKPGLISVEQADGTQISIYIKGDEYFSWRTTESGYPIGMGSDGYYYYASYSSLGQISLTEQRVSIDGVLQSPPAGVTKSQMTTISRSANASRRVERSAVTTRSSINGFPNQGEVKAAVILVEYSDVAFSIENPNQAFTNQLNQEGYSVSGATGSARDYFWANSRGQFDGQFDVYGPYTLENTRSYYGANDEDGLDLLPDQMVWDAVAMADEAGVDFSQYDNNGDGYIDNVFVYYAGHNEAEGATEDSIWPHMWAVASRPTFDGKRLYIYACTSELRGSSGSVIAGIGTFCHEFSHIFGLADHYDTDGSTGGSSPGLGYYDIMTSGSYNNSGNTPPMHNGLELDMIGWNSPIVLEKEQEITIDPIHCGEVYKILTDVEDEYFLIENHQRSAIVWDNYISASGLFITHIDRSSDYISKWDDNNPNGETSHECFRFIVAGNKVFSVLTERYVPYPYLTNDSWTASSTPAAASWSGEAPAFCISDIVQNSDGTVSFSVIQNKQSLSGKVTDDGGKAIAGATLKFYAESSDDIYETVTDENGEYSIEEIDKGSYEVLISAPFCSDYYGSVYIASGANSKDFEITSYYSSIEQMEISAAQTEVTIKWNPQTYSSFIVTVSGDELGEISAEVDNDCTYTFTGLEPSTSYSVTISGKESSGEYSEIYSGSFTTIAQNTTLPLINLIIYNYSVGEQLELKILNSQDGDVVSWQIDDTQLSTSYVTLTAGEHTIKATVTRGSSTYYINKKIYVE